VLDAEDRFKQAIDDPRPSIPAEEVFKELRELRALPLEPAVWGK